MSRQYADKSLRSSVTVSNLANFQVDAIDTGSHADVMAQGIVKFFKSERSWAAITSLELPDGLDAFAHYPAIEDDGFRMLNEGERVEFDFEQKRQDSFRYVATCVRRL